MTKYFSLLDRIFILFSYENRKKKFLVIFSCPRLRRRKASKFTFGGVQYRARFETEDSIAVKTPY